MPGCWRCAVSITSAACSWRIPIGLIRRLYEKPPRFTLGRGVCDAWNNRRDESSPQLRGRSQALGRRALSDTPHHQGQADALARRGHAFHQGGVASLRCADDGGLVAYEACHDSHQVSGDIPPAAGGLRAIPRFPSQMGLLILKAVLTAASNRRGSWRRRVLAGIVLGRRFRLRPPRKDRPDADLPGATLLA